MQLAQANTLTSFGATGSRRRELSTLRVESQHARVVGSGAWQLEPAAFQYSMCVVAVVVINGMVMEEGDVAAFANGQLRGTAHPSSYTAPAGQYKGYKSFNLMVYGQAGDEGAAIACQYRHADGHVSKLALKASFARDASLGTVRDPLVLSIAGTHVTT